MKNKMDALNKQDDQHDFNVSVDCVVIPQKITKWYNMHITENQLEYLKMICRFHIDLSKNEKAVERTEKILRCLNSKNFIMEMDDKANRILDITKVINEEY